LRFQKPPRALEGSGKFWRLLEFLGIWEFLEDSRIFRNLLEGLGRFQTWPAFNLTLGPNFSKN
jgi:hypothetical protein